MIDHRSGKKRTESKQMKLKFLKKTPVAWLQVTRERTRLAVAIAGIAFADMLIFLQMGFEGALYGVYGATEQKTTLSPKTFLCKVYRL